MDCTGAILYLDSHGFLPGTARAPPFMEEAIGEAKRGMGRREGRK
ncbi:MAG: hypothetical protein M5U10_13090 [Candidatus Methanoperedens sp.]|nr:hypothetical protein [Candidatus Methanoperedens nitroreducens]MDJ1422837.1 hypothetical protein [Candidatus Methanoperedens sp.]